MEFIDVCSQDDIPPGKSLAVRAAGCDIALFNVDGTVHAIENSCPHQGGALSGGEFCNRVVKCRAHGWRIDVTTGALAGSDKPRVRCFPVAVADGRINVLIHS